MPLHVFEIWEEPPLSWARVLGEIAPGDLAPEAMASCVQQVRDIRRERARKFLVLLLCSTPGATMQRMDRERKERDEIGVHEFSTRFD